MPRQIVDDASCVLSACCRGRHGRSPLNRSTLKDGPGDDALPSHRRQRDACHAAHDPRGADVTVRSRQKHGAAHRSGLLHESMDRILGALCQGFLNAPPTRPAQTPACGPATNPEDGGTAHAYARVIPDKQAAVPRRAATPDRRLRQGAGLRRPRRLSSPAPKIAGWQLEARRKTYRPTTQTAGRSYRSILIHRCRYVALQRFCPFRRRSFQQRHSRFIFRFSGVLTPERAFPYKPLIDDALPPPTGGRKTRLRRSSRLDCCEAAG